MAKIFVSYRRRDSASATGRIVEHLSKRFGKSAVFKDVFSIRAGQQFRDAISEQLDQTQVLLAVIGNNWVDAADDSGNRRLEDSDDYVRFEVARGLARPECTVIPVLVDNQPIPKQDDLPEAIRELVERNAVHVRPDPDFADDVEQLCRVVADHVPAKKRWPLPVAAVALVCLAIIGALFLGPGRNPPDTVVQAFDSSTGERLLRPFALTLANGNHRTSGDAQYVIADTNPSDVEIESVVCDGFEFSQRDQNSEVTKSNGNHLLKIFLNRSVEFLDSIKPDIGFVEGLPTDNQIQDQIQDNTVPAEDVELLIDNLTSQHIDVLLYWLPPSTSESLTNPFVARWTHLNDGAIPPGGRASFDSFGLSPGYFVFFGSVKGQRAVMLDSAALYKAPFALVTITELSREGISFDFSTMRSEIPDPPNA